MHHFTNTDKPALTLIFVLGIAYSVFSLRQQSQACTHGNPVFVPKNKHKREPYANLRLPLELCEYIIDFLWDDLDALGACALTCPAFAIRSDYLMDGISRANCLTNERAFNTLFSDLLASKEYSRYFDVLKIRTEEYKSWVSTAPLRLASKLPRLEQLELIGVFDPQKSHHNSIQHFSIFRSVTTLRLAECAFSKFADFARLVMALRNLTTLDILDVDWDEYQIQPNLLGPTRAKKLHFTDFYIDVSIGRHGYVPQLLNWFVTTPVTKTITTLSVEIRFAGDYEFLTKFLRVSGDTLRRLKVHTHPGIMREAPLSDNMQIHVLTSLESLIFDGVGLEDFSTFLSILSQTSRKLQRLALHVKTPNDDDIDHDNWKLLEEFFIKYEFRDLSFNIGFSILGTMIGRDEDRSTQLLKRFPVLEARTDYRPPKT